MKLFPTVCASLALLLCACGDTESSARGSSQTESATGNVITEVRPSPPQTAPDVSTPAASADPVKPTSKGWVIADGFNVTDNGKLNEYICELEDLCGKYGYRVGFFYENMVTHATLQYNSYKKFLTASTIKAPYVKYLLEENVDLNEKIKLETVWDDGDASIGQLTKADEGREFTVKALIEKTVQLSDNSAYNNLIRHFGTDGFNAMQGRVKTSAVISKSDIFTSACAIEQARSYKDIYEFAENNSSGKWLINLLENCETDLQIGRALREKYAVAQKYGAEYDEEPMTYNDCAICYAGKPFVLCILTELEPNTEESNSFFREAALVFDRINDLIVN